ncbi:MAG: GvpL/GvpF family gas vesicle protein [Bacteroidota bacterium]
MKKLLYAILSLNDNPGRVIEIPREITGISEDPLSVIRYDGIAAVAGDFTGETAATGRTAALRYAGIIENLSLQFTLLPVRFGSVMESDGAVISMLEKNHPAILANLQKVDRRFEFGLKIFCDAGKLSAFLVNKTANEETTGNPPTPDIQPSVFREYVNKKLKAHRLEELMLAYVDSVIAIITLKVAGLTSISRFTKMASASNLIDAVFLLEKEKKDELVATIAGLMEEYPMLTFMLTGPWPPYNFVDLTLK